MYEQHDRTNICSCMYFCLKCPGRYYKETVQIVSIFSKQNRNCQGIAHNISSYAFLRYK